MGKLDLGDLGGVSGKIGPFVVYKTKNGKQIIRSYVVPKDARSPKQLACRKRFGTVSSGLSPLKNIIRSGYQNSDDAYLNVTSKALKEAVAGEYPDYWLDYSKIQVAEGKLQLPPDIAVKVDETAGTARFSWEPQPVNNSCPGSADDRVNIVCLNEAIPAAVNFLNSAKRSAGSATIDLKSKIGLYDSPDPGSLHFWVYLTSRDFLQNSDSVYVKR